MNKDIVIVYHSASGHTRRVAEAVAEGASAALLPIDAEGSFAQHGWDMLAGARAIIFGSPTYMGNVSWQFKKFADASSRIWATQGWKDKMGAAFTHSASIGGDKQMAIAAMFTLAQQHGMLWAGMGMMPANMKASVREDVNYLASFAGLATATPADATADEISPGDLRTARLFGQRIRAVAMRIS